MYSDRHHDASMFPIASPPPAGITARSAKTRPRPWADHQPQRGTAPRSATWRSPKRTSTTSRSSMAALRALPASRGAVSPDLNRPLSRLPSPEDRATDGRRDAAGTHVDMRVCPPARRNAGREHARITRSGPTGLADGEPRRTGSAGASPADSVPRRPPTGSRPRLRSSNEVCEHG